MYKHILVPTDGTPLSTKAITTAVRLAGDLGARVTGLYVVPPYQAPMYSEGVVYSPALTKQRYKELTRKEADKALEVLEAAAKKAGVPCGTEVAEAGQPSKGIHDVAKAKKCDLIVMASHGRRGLAGVLLGSETVKVLTHSKIPVLVCR